MSMLLPMIGLGLLVLASYYFSLFLTGKSSNVKKNSARSELIREKQRALEQSLKKDKRTGCFVPKLDPFSPEIMVFNRNLSQIVCDDLDWVKCNLSKCAVTPSILNSTKDIKCYFYDIIHKTDRDYYVDSKSTMITSDKVFTLENSDNVKVTCTGTALANDSPMKWVGVVSGLRSKVKPLGPPRGREKTINVLMFGYDTTSRNGFIRKMPESYEYLKNDLEATFLTSYNIIGDGTTWALHALLTGRNELDLPEARKRFVKTFLNNNDFIFHKLRKDGYRTAYYEDSPNMGTFQLRFQGFGEQPADHYLRDFYFEVAKLRTGKKNEFCVGDTPSYLFLMNITKQFFMQDGKKFCFTMVGDMCHHDFNLITSADKDFVKFLRWFNETGRLQNTLLMVFGDHGLRRADVRATYQGKMEERLPLMAIVLPELLVKSRPEIKSALKANADILTTPYDIYNTVLDAVDMKDHWITYKVNGADLPRGLTLFRPIPSTRSCSEAAVESRWCTCHTWQTIRSSDKTYHLAAAALVDHINNVTESIRQECKIRKLSTINYVNVDMPNPDLMACSGSSDRDGYVAKCTQAITRKTNVYKVKVVLLPGNESYEATMTYLMDENRFIVKTQDISLIHPKMNQYSCVRAVLTN